MLNNASTTILLNEIMSNETTNRLLQDALSTYPLYKGKKDYGMIPTREALNKKLLNRYRFYEIGFETVGRFLFELESTMELIMPRYNEMFKTIEIMADLENPFDNVDITETIEEEREDNTSTTGSVNGTQTATTNATASSNTSTTGTNESTTTNESENENNHTRKFSDTPQNNISNINNYLTDYTDENTSGTQNTTDTTSGSSTATTEGSDSSESNTTATDTTATTGEMSATGTVSRTLHRKGNHGVNTYAHDMNEFRTSIIDIVEQIIEDERVHELFMLVW